MKNKLNRAQLNVSEAIKEIQNRTGLPDFAIQKVLDTYIDIVKECICNEVEVVFGDIGYFGWKHYPKRDNVELKNPNTGEKIVKNFPAHNALVFRQKRNWKIEMRKQTAKLFSENELEEIE